MRLASLHKHLLVQNLLISEYSGRLQLHDTSLLGDRLLGLRCWHDHGLRLLDHGWHVLMLIRNDWNLVHVGDGHSDSALVVITSRDMPLRVKFVICR